MKEIFSGLGDSSTPVSNNNTPVKTAPQFLSSKRELVTWLCIGATGLFAFMVCITASVALGTCIGVGVPMARTASESFKHGMQAGLAKCPCANKGPTPIGQSVPKPTAVGQTLVLNPQPETPGGKSVTPETPKVLFETLKVEPVSTNPKAFEVKETVVPVRRTAELPKGSSGGK